MDCTCLGSSCCLYYFASSHYKGTSLRYTFEKRRIYSAANIEKFRNKLNDVNWSTVLDAQTTNDKYTHFVDIIDGLTNSCFPLTTIKINPIRDSKPWITPTILNSVKKKNTMYKQYLITKSPTLLDSYKKYKNKLTSILRQKKIILLQNC